MQTVKEKGDSFEYVKFINIFFMRRPNKATEKTEEEKRAVNLTYKGLLPRIYETSKNQ